MSFSDLGDWPTLGDALERQRELRSRIGAAIPNQGHQTGCSLSEVDRDARLIEMLHNLALQLPFSEMSALGCGLVCPAPE